MRPEHGKGGDVAVALGAFLLHLSEHVSDDAAVVIFGDVEELWPREDVVEVVLHLVVLWEAEEIAGLHCKEVVDSRFAYANHC